MYTDGNLKKSSGLNRPWVAKFRYWQTSGALVLFILATSQMAGFPNVSCQISRNQFMDISPIISRMREAFAEIERKLSAPDAFSDRQSYEQLTREHQRLSSLLSIYDQQKKKEKELVDNQELLALENDEDMAELIQADIATLEEDIRKLDAKVLALILPPDKNDSRNTIMEIRPAAGGEEAALFAGDLFRMYNRFAESQGWRVEVLNITETDLGGIKDIGFSLTGTDVYRVLKLESGVHRVQRIPTTETGGRIHTSTVTVAVLPEAEEVDVHIDPSDLQVDVFRASGAGGQHVNTTDSAVRITHIPTGVVVSSQQERSQHRNREICMRILRSRILEAKQLEEQAKYDATRKAQVGTGDRSERIRTYNYPQNRITDHRFGLSWFSLPAIMEGDIQDMLEEILAENSKRRLESELEKQL